MGRTIYDGIGSRWCPASLPIDIRNISFGERGFPVEDLTAKTKYEHGFRIGRFDFPCIALADIEKFNMAIVVNRMELPKHLYHGYLVIAPLLTRVNKYGENLGYDNTDTPATSNVYLLYKTIYVHSFNLKTITDIHYTLWYARVGAGGVGEGMRVTYQIDAGAETTLFERENDFTGIETWCYETCSLIGNLITIRVYLKWGGGAGNADITHNKYFELYGEQLSEISGEKFTVEHGEYI